MNQLEQLKQYTTVVADTGDFSSIKEFAPRDATTNPSLILKAAKKPEYKPLLEKVVREHRWDRDKHDTLDHLLVAFGLEILKVIPGRVSTEVDARLSFDTEATIEKGRKLMELYSHARINPERVLIKIASTWEGIRAAEALERRGIRCNMTLLFSPVQALACAEVEARLISPFVGRIYDWYKKANNEDYTGANDPGVQSVRSIFDLYNHFDYKTEIMGASFRNTSQILELAGCDLLTISPDLLKKLTESDAPVERKLTRVAAEGKDFRPPRYTEKAFRFEMNNNAMATEKLAEGIRQFCEDTSELERIIDSLREEV